jgi:hypothetical protein
MLLGDGYRKIGYAASGAHARGRNGSNFRGDTKKDARN